MDRANEEKNYRDLVRKIMREEPDAISKVVVPNLDKYKRYAKENIFNCYILVKLKKETISIPVGILIEPFINEGYMDIDEYDDFVEYFEGAEYLDDFCEDEKEELETANEGDEDEYSDKYSYLDDEEYECD